VEEGAKNFGVFRVKNHDFTPKNYIVSNCGGRRENFWGISCEKSRFYAIKSYFFQFYQPKPYFISVIYGFSLQLQYGKLEKSLKCQKVL
jgi:hypothetical protein